MVFRQSKANGSDVDSSQLNDLVEPVAVFSVTVLTNNSIQLTGWGDSVDQ